jgi:hypothetical protein
VVATSAAHRAAGSAPTPHSQRVVAYK